MTRNALILLIFFCALLVSVFTNTGYSSDNIGEPSMPVVVELYTSQGCSSCPPADRILSELAKQDNIIALGCHVSYWNHLRWKDTLSQDFCDMRQHGYIGMRGEKRIYTPQMIVNGIHQFVGSRSGEVKAALEKADARPIQYIDIETTDPQTIRFSLPHMPEDNYRLWAFGYQKQLHQDIERGENSGKSINYTNPVISYINLGSWKGASVTHSFEKPQEDIDGIAILAQRDGYGEIIAAGKFEF